MKRRTLISAWPWLTAPMAFGTNAHAQASGPHPRPLPQAGEGVRPAGAPTKGELRVGFQKGGLLPLVKVRGLLEQRLAPLGWSVAWREFPAGPQLLEAFNVDAIDVGVTGSPPPIFAQAARADFVYIAAEPGQPHSEAVLVKPDSPLRAIADLKGRRVGLQKGSSSHYLLLASLAKAGLTLRDVQPVYLSPADARAAFERGAIDAWVVWDPYLTFAQAATKARVLADYSVLAPESPPWSFYEARRAFAAAHGALLREQVIPLLAEAGRWANEHREESARLVAPMFGVPEALLLQLGQRVRYGAVPLTPAIASDQQRIADAFHAQGLIPTRISVKDAFWGG